MQKTMRKIIGIISQVANIAELSRSLSHVNP